MFCSLQHRLVKSLFKLRPSTISWKPPSTVNGADILDETGLAALHIAAEANDVSRILELTRRGASMT